MKMTGNISDQGDQLGLPWDLREWFGEFTLLRWIEEDVETLEWDNTNLLQFLRAHPEFRPKPLLVLLTYAYATATYSAEDIACECDTDGLLRGVCAGFAPSKKEILAFRRENRGLLKWFLTQLFKRALREKFELRDALLPGGLKRRLEEAAITRIDLARHLDRGPHAD